MSLQSRENVDSSQSTNTPVLGFNGRSTHFITQTYKLLEVN